MHAYLVFIFHDKFLLYDYNAKMQQANKSYYLGAHNQCFYFSECLLFNLQAEKHVEEQYISIFISLSRFSYE